MDRFPERALAAVRDSLRRMRVGGLERRRQNYAEIARILSLAGLPDHAAAVERWIKADHAREDAREARARAASARRRSQRLRARARLRVIEGSDPGSP